MSPSLDAQELLAIAARSEMRLALALRRTGISFGDAVSASYADVDPLGQPVVRLGPLAAQAADRLSGILEAVGMLDQAVHDVSASGQVGRVAPC